MWKFLEMRKGEMNVDPYADEFFNTQALDNRADALVREAVQNSLDAKCRSTPGPVHVAIGLTSIDNKLTSEISGGLSPHLAACPVTEPRAALPDKLPVLLVEDFNTTGLTGDPAAFDDPPPGSKNNFYYFWRNIGRANKSGDDRGRWGLGKTMFPASSTIHSILGLTVVEDQPSPLVMGQSILSIHRVDNVKYQPYGYFGVDDGDFVLPIRGDQAHQWMTRLPLRREPGQKGLSIAVLHPEESMDSSSIVAAILNHYFFPLLQGELTVEVWNDEQSLTIDSSSLTEQARKTLDPESSRKLVQAIDLAQWLIEADVSDVAVLNNPSDKESAKPIWSPDLLGSSTLETLADRLDRNLPVGFEVPIYIRRVNEEAKAGTFRVALKRMLEPSESTEYFIRQGITVSGVRSLRERGVVAIVEASDSSVATFLGDSENPAHTEWQPNSSKFKGKYWPGTSTLTFIKSAPRELLKILNGRSEELDETALRSIFSAAAESAWTAMVPEQTDGDEDTPKPEVKVDPRPKKIRIEQVAGGFVVRSTNDLVELGSELAIRVAYEVAKGNSFKKWRPADFDIADNRITLELDGLAVIEAKGNAILARVDSKEFRLRVRGFDTKRDLSCRVVVRELEDA